MDTSVARTPVSNTRPRTSRVVCFACGTPGHTRPSCPKQTEKRETLVTCRGGSLGDSHQPLRKLTVPVSFGTDNTWQVTSALVDSGSAGNFVSRAFADTLHLTLEPLPSPIPVRVVDGTQLVTSITHRTPLLCMRVGALHQEYLHFLVMEGCPDDVLLGMPWLAQHNPQFSWSQGELLRWSDECSRNCLMSVDPAARPTIPQDLASLPAPYAHYADVFCKQSAETLPEHRPYDCAIDLLPGSIPPRGAVYPLSVPETQAMADYIKENLARGFIRKSTSPAGAGFFFVAKKDGSLRPCIDYRGLNSITVKNRYPLPLISELFDRLQGATIFTKLDLRGAYNLIRIREGDEWKTAFNTRDGHYEYLVMPFGLCNAPAVFQDFVNDVFRDMLLTSVVVYLDDILVFSHNITEHRRTVRTVLSRLRQHHLYAKLEKCVFEQERLPFLGYIVSAQGLEMDPSKLSAIMDWPRPQSLKSMQRFLGFANYYRQFIPHFSTLTSPLSSMTKKGANPKLWSAAAERSFTTLKEHFVRAPVLHRPDSTKQFCVEVDASSVGAGALLFQKGPKGRRVTCAYFSKLFTPAERNYSIGDRELLAIKLALTEWRHLLEGAVHSVHIYTDHKNLTYLQTAQRLNARQARWALFFARFDFVLHFVPGEKNVRADALSRVHESGEEGEPEDPRLIIPVDKQLVVAPADLVRVPRGKTLVPQSRRKEVLEWAHSSRLGAHFGYRRTLALLSRSYWWPSMPSDVRAYVEACTTCARNKPSRLRPAGLLVPLPVPTAPWQAVGMDFITDLPPSDGHTVIWVVVDHFSRMSILVPLPGLPTARELARLFIQHVFRVHGMPERVISDRGTQFTSRFWRALCQELRTELCLSSAYHPESNGLVERLNQTLETYLRHFVSSNHDNWATLLTWAELALNNAVADATGSTPFFLVYGRHPRIPMPFPITSEVPAVADWAREAQRVWTSAQTAISASKSRMRVSADRRRRPEFTLAPGDAVWLSAKNLRLRVPSLRFAPRFVGPFKVVSQVTPVTYRLRLPLTWRVHHTFHVSLLKPVKLNRYSVPLPEESESPQDEYEVRAIVDIKRVRGRVYYLVDWVGYGPEDRSWEPAENISAPQLIAEFERSRSRASASTRRGGGSVRLTRRPRPPRSRVRGRPQPE